MINILIFMRDNVERSKAIMSTQVNKHRKSIKYFIDDMIWSSSRNIKTVRFFKKLKDKMLSSYKVIGQVETSYKLELLKVLKIHDVFHSSLLRLNLNDSIDEQIFDVLKSIEISADNEWVVNDILDFRQYEKSKRLQYRVKWNDFDIDSNWYNIDRDEFDNATNVIRNFHKRYSDKSKS